MRSLIAQCVRHRLFVALLALLLMAWGLARLQQVPLDVFPEFVAPQLSIQTEAPGWSPEQVEQRVTAPIEAALAGAPDVAAERSESIAGLSVITLSLADGSDPIQARQAIAERLGTTSALMPNGVSVPKLSPLTSSTMDLLKVGLTSTTLDRFALRELADWTLKPALLSVPGVARVTVFGGDVRQWHIQVDPLRVEAAGIGISDVIAAAQAAIATKGGGVLELAAQQIPIVVMERSDIAEALASAVIRSNPGRPLRIADVAEVRAAPMLRIGDALINGNDGVLLAVSGQFGSNTLEVTRAVETALAQLQSQLRAQGVNVVAPLHRPANFIERALHDLTRTLVIAAILVIALLALFLRNARSAFISFVTIPLSLLAAIVVIHASGGTLNTMTLGGFAVALGVVVDDAVIDIENVMRRLQANLSAPSPRSALAVILDASLEIRAPVLYATVVLVLVFLPVFALTGVQGRLLAPMAAAFVGSVLASLVVALTVTPALCALLLREPKPEHEPRWWLWLWKKHRDAVRWIDRHFRATGVALTVVFLACTALIPALKGEFLPMFREGHFVLQVSAKEPGTSIAEMLNIGRSISKEVLALPFVASIEQQVGRAEQGEDTWGSHRSEFHVELKHDATIDQAEAQEALRDVLEHYPGVQSEVMTFLGDRISETLTGDTAQVMVNVIGPDLDRLDQVAAKIMRTAATTAGVVDLKLGASARAPEIEVVLDSGRLQLHGMRAADVVATIASGFAGALVGQVNDHHHPTDVIVQLPETARNRIEAVAELSVIAPDGGRLPLSALATVRLSDGRYSVQHDSGRRRVGVGFNVHGRAAGEVVAELRTELGKLSLPTQTFLMFTGIADAERDTQRTLAFYTLVALALIGMCLGLAFRRPVHAIVVLLNLPFALTGSVLVIAFTGIDLSIGALVGLVTVFGISARNAILLLAHYEHLVLVEGEQWSPELAWRGASERLRPVLMTALVTALGMLPLALGLGKPGHEIEGPLALTVLGGLASSTLLTLLVVPAMARRFSFPVGRATSVAIIQTNVSERLPDGDDAGRPE